MKATVAILLLFPVACFGQAARPTSQPSGGAVIHPAQRIWKAKPGAPQSIVKWLEEQPAYRKQLLDMTDQIIIEKQTAIDRATQAVNDLQRSPIPSIRTATGRGSAVEVPNEEAGRERVERLREMRQAIVVQRKELADWKSKRAQVAADTNRLVVLSLKPVMNSFGSFNGEYKVSQVVDAENILISYRGMSLWLTGVDGSKLADDQAISVNGTYRIDRNRTYTTAIGGSRTVFVAEPCDYLDWVEQGDATPEELKAWDFELPEQATSVAPSPARAPARAPAQRGGSRAGQRGAR